jgi:hypothetical protein
MQSEGAEANRWLGEGANAKKTAGRQTEYNKIAHTLLISGFSQFTLSFVQLIHSCFSGVRLLL